ncbi:alpha/beta hydrolase [Gracilibacillus phocaeensis]|uniref:alpha/beta hydrolase n=1 Tax=Gracilibacillus phocaeensis TaxID=2042304 RepID=UPI0010325A13|nr:alpha/beta fold hydrolase [Gracilibacillus phocaeensis]
MMKRLWIVTALVVLVSCANQSEEDVETKSRDLLSLLADGSYQTLVEDYYAETLQEQSTAADLQHSWETNKGDNFIELGELNATTQQDYTIIETEARFEETSVHIRLTWNEDEKLQGIYIQANTQEVEKSQPPEDVTEEEIVLNQGKAYELSGRITMPTKTDAESPIPGVVLVHGSGPSDMNEAIYAYQPFQNIAYGLAEQGIAVLRYHKRTYQYGEELMEDVGNKLTVQEETIDDAVEAAKLLQEDERIDRVYIIGHSLGGMLAPRIGQQAETEGLVILAGSPRFFWEIISDQQLAAIPSDMDEEEKAQYVKEIEKQKELASSMLDVSDEAAAQQEIYGVSGYYLKEMAQYDAGQIALESDKPLLILQGEADFQVSMEHDFSEWQELMHNHSLATLKSYPELNHFFIESQGEQQGTVQEYTIPDHVDEQVISDIAEWVFQQGG